MASVAKLHNPMVTMGLSKQQQVIREACYKATHRYPKPPKESHLLTIINAASSSIACHEVLARLEKRIEKKNWAVVLKTLFITHRCYVDGSDPFIDALKDRAARFFVLRTFSIHNEASNATTFIKKYAKYLEEKCSVYRLTGFQFEKKKETFKTMVPPVTKNIKWVHKIQSQLNALLNCKMRAPLIQSNLIFKKVFVLVLKDAVRLYSMVNDAVLLIMNEFWSSSPDEAKIFLAIYKLYVRETDAILTLLEVGRSVIPKGVPSIEKLDTSILTSMEKYIGTSGTSEVNKGSSKRKVQAQEMTSGDFKVDFSSSDEDRQNQIQVNEDSADSNDASYSSASDSDQLDEFVMTLKQNFMQPSLQAHPQHVQPVYAPQPVAVAPNPFQPVYAPQPVAQPNPFATGTPVAGNPFATNQQATNPFVTNNTNPFATTPTSFTTNNPFATNSFSNLTFTPAQPQPVPVTTGGNPFATTPVASNPFVQH